VLKFKYKNKIGEVMMVGTKINSKGGIAAVVRGYSEASIMKRQKIDYYPSHCDGRTLTKLCFYLKNLAIIMLNLYRYKIVHVHMASKWSFRRLSLVLIIAKIFKKKTIVHLHGAMFNIYFYRAKDLEKLFIRYIFSNADRIIVLSEEWRKKIAQMCINEKIVVIPNSVSLKCNKRHNEIISSNYPRKILFLGEIGFRKGIYDLIEALSLIQNNYKYKALLCGTGEIEKALSEIKKYGLENNVELVGWVDGNKKNKLLQEAYLYVLPSYHEGLPVSILEAMAFGNPVITTPVGGIPQIVREGINGFLVPPGSPQMIADRIMMVFDSPTIWEELSINAYNTIKSKFTSEQMEKSLYNLYQGLKSM
jgi:glycosyltransferase involved in cell wall biosynthesis